MARYGSNRGHDSLVCLAVGEDGGALSLVVDLAEQGRQLRVLKCRFQNMDEGLANGANKYQAAHSINGSAARPVVYPFIHGSAPLDNMAAPDQILEVNSYRT